MNVISSVLTESLRPFPVTFWLPLPSIRASFQNAKDGADSFLWYPWFHLPFIILPAHHHPVHLLSTNLGITLQAPDLQYLLPACQSSSSYPKSSYSLHFNLHFSHQHSVELKNPILRMDFRNHLVDVYHMHESLSNIPTKWSRLMSAPGSRNFACHPAYLWSWPFWAHGYVSHFCVFVCATVMSSSSETSLSSPVIPHHSRPGSHTTSAMKNGYGTQIITPEPRTVLWWQGINDK